MLFRSVSQSQTMLNQAEAAKALAEAKKTSGVDTKKTENEIKWQEIENRIQESREQIAGSNVTEAKANKQSGSDGTSIPTNRAAKCSNKVSNNA